MFTSDSKIITCRQRPNGEHSWHETIRSSYQVVSTFEPPESGPYIL